MSDSGQSRSSSDLNDLMRAVVARHFPERDRQEKILLQLRMASLVDNADVVEALDVLDRAKPEDLEAAFDLIRLHAAAAPIPPGADPREWARSLTAAIGARIGEIVAPLRDLFVMPLAVAAGVARDDPESEPVRLEDLIQMTFVVPEALVETAGLAPMGQMDIDDTDFYITIVRRRPLEVPRLVVTIESAGYRAPPARLIVSGEDVAATVDWPSEDVPDNIRIGVLIDEGGEAAGG